MVSIRDIRVFRPVPSRMADSAELSPQECRLALAVPTPGKRKRSAIAAARLLHCRLPYPAGNAAREAFGLPIQVRHWQRRFGPAMYVGCGDAGRVPLLPRIYTAQLPEFG